VSADRDTDASAVPASHAWPEEDLARELVGTWISEVRDTEWGPLRFEFRFDENSRFSVTATPAESSETDRYDRGGPYRLENNMLITPALNEGQPVHVELRESRLVLTISEALQFELRKRCPRC
jgi:hypothetical protein